MRQLHGALEEADLTGEHQLGTFDQAVLDVSGIEEGGRDPVGQGDDEVIAVRRASGLAFLGGRDDADEGDVLALLGLYPVFSRPVAEDRHPLNVFPRIVAQQLADSTNSEDLVEQAGGFGTQQAVKPVGQRRHRYSTRSAERRRDVRCSS